MPKLSPRMIKYFWQEKGDIRRYSDYSDKDAREQYSLVAAALVQYELAKRTLDIIVSDLPDDEEED